MASSSTVVYHNGNAVKSSSSGELDDDVTKLSDLAGKKGEQVPERISESATIGDKGLLPT
jgi:hypothetical protein